MATIDLRRLNSDLATTEITWGEILTTFGSGQSLDRVLRDLYDQGLVKFTFTDNTVAQDVSRNAYRSLSQNSYSAAQKGKTLQTIEAEGSSSTDTITGTHMAETIRAGSGDDVVTGGGGADMLAGGRGRDTFAYKATSDSATGQQDVITDFKASEGDRIDLSGLGTISWGGQTALGGGKASAWYSTTGSVASLFVDTDGNGTADMRIDLKGVTSVAYTDLIGVSKPATPPVMPPVTPPVTPPTATQGKPDTATITEDARIALASGNVLSNDGSGYKLSTVNGQTVSSKGAVIKGEHGTLVIGQDGKWIYTLNNKDAKVQELGVGDTLPETFTYVATGKNGTTVTSTLTVTIKGANDGPVAVSDSPTAINDGLVVIDVLKNDSDKDGDTLTISSAKVISGNGAVTIENGKLVYDTSAYADLKPGVTADVKISYEISDSHGGKSTATATLILTGKAPDPSNIVIDVGISEQKAFVLNADKSHTLIGDEYDGLSFDNVGSDETIVFRNASTEMQIVEIKQGSAILLIDTDGDGTVDTTIRLEGDGLDGSKLSPNDFVLTATDNGMAMTFAPVNDAPVAEAGTASGQEDGEAITGSVQAIDKDSSTLTYSVVQGPTAEQGTLVLQPNGSYSFTPAKDYNGTATFTYKANDGTVDSNTAAVTITVAAMDEPNTAPVATGGDTSGDEDAEAITGQVGGTDAEGSPLTYKLVAPVEGLTLNPNGSYSYTPAKDFNGPVTFEYVANDGKVDSAPAAVTITVDPVVEAPVFPEVNLVSGSTEVSEGGVATYTFERDGDTSDALEIDVNVTGSATAGDHNGVAGKVTFAVGSATATYTIRTTDDDAVEPPETIVVEVAQGNGYTVGEDVKATTNLLDNDVEAPPVERPTVAIGDATASEAAGSIEIPVTLSHAYTSDVTLTYEMTTAAKTVTFDNVGAEHAAIPAGYEGARWTGINSSGDGAALTATTGGGQIQALSPNGLSVTSLTVSTASTNQVVTLQAIKGGNVVATQTVTLGNGGPQSAAVTLGPQFSGIDALHIDGAANSSGDYPIKIDNVVMAGGSTTTGQVTIAAGQTTGSITVPVVNDSTYEVGETISVKLTGATNATLGTDVTGVATITNDDGQPLPQITFVDVYLGDVLEGGVSQEFEVVRDIGFDKPLTVTLESALFGNQTVTIPAGEEKLRVFFGPLEDQVLTSETYEITLAPSADYLPGEVTSVSGRYIDNDGNADPEAYDLSNSLFENTLEAEGFLFNGQGWDNQQWPLSYEIVEQPTAWGTVVLTDVDYGSGPLFKFTPHAGVFDNLNAGSEQKIAFSYVAKDGVGGVSDPATFTLTVWGNDEAPAAVVPEINATGATGEVAEGGMATFGFERTGNLTNPLTVNIDFVGSATAGQDFTALTSVTFAAGSATATLNVQTTRDATTEGGETIEFRIAEGQGYTVGAADGNVTDLVDAPAVDPNLPTISIADVAALEGNNSAFFFKLSAPAATPLVITYQIIHGNTTDADLPATAVAGTYTVNMARGVVDRQLNIRSVEDLDFEPNETFTIKILSVKTGGVNGGADAPVTILDGEAIGTITNDDTAPGKPPGVTLSKDQLAVTEGGATDTFTVVLDAAPTANVTVNVSTGNELEARGPNGTGDVVFTTTNWSTPQTVTVLAQNDYVADGAMTDTVYFMTSSSDARYNDLPINEVMMPVTITDAAAEPVMPYVSVASKTAEVTEGGEMTFAFFRSDAGDGDLAINYDMTGLAESDIAAIKWNGVEDGFAGFLGDEQWAYMTVVLADDTEIEQTETLTVTLKPSPAYLEEDILVVTGDVLDNDAPEPVILPEISVGPAGAVTEGDTTTFTLSRTGLTTAALTVAYTLGGTATAGEDYAAPTGTVTFAEGEADAIVTVQTTDDSEEESAETVELTVSPSTTYTITQATASSTISANDVPVVEEPPQADPDQTITAVTTAGVNFTGGTGTDTLYFQAIPTGTPQLMSGANTSGVISLGGTISGTVYNGKTISNIENLTFDDIRGALNQSRNLTINGDAEDNTIIVNRTNIKTSVNGGDGADTITFTGVGTEAPNSVISGGTGNDKVTVTNTAIVDDRVASGTSGDDTYIFGAGKQELRFGAESGNDTITNFGSTEDTINFAQAGIDASTVTVTESDGNTVFTINGNTVTVEGVQGMQFGTHWTAQGTYAPPADEPPVEEPPVDTSVAGVDVSNLSMNVAEGGASATTEVKLTRQPTSDVTITLGSDGGVLFSVEGAAPSATPTLTFTSTNWNQAQVVTVSAIDDAEYQAQGPGTTIYFAPITTTDPAYADVLPPSGYATIAENDSAPVIEPPTAQAMSTHVWEDNPVAELQGNGFSVAESGIVEYEIVSQPVEGGTVTMTDDRTFHFEGDKASLSALNRGETKAVSFEYRVSDGKEWSAPATMTFNVHGFTNGADERVQATENNTPSQSDTLALNGGDGNDTLVFTDLTLTSGEDLEISLGHKIHWTEYNGKLIENFENITINGTNGEPGRSLTVGGDDQANVLTIENTSHKLLVNGRGGADTINFQGTTGDSEVNVADGNDTVNLSGGGNVTVRNFSTGDMLDFTAAGIQATDVTVTESNGNTVFAANGATLATVEGMLGMEFGTDWKAVGVITPPEPEPDPEPQPEPVQPDVEPLMGADASNFDDRTGGTARGTAGADIITDAVGASTTISSLGGDDQAYGRDGNDVLTGGNGADKVYGGSGNDSINGDGGPANLTTNPGSAGADELFGGDGDDTINGQDGNDMIVGGHGADNLTGGLGDDTFVFNDIFDRGDIVNMQGQQAANDVFDFRNFDFDPNTDGRQAATNGVQLIFEAAVAGQMVEDAIYYDSATGRMSINTGKDGVEDFHTTVNIGTGTTHPVLNQSDFLL